MSSDIKNYIKTFLEQKGSNKNIVEYLKIFDTLIEYLSDLNTNDENQVNTKRTRIYPVNDIVDLILDIKEQIPLLDIPEFIDILNKNFDLNVTDFDPFMYSIHKREIKLNTNIDINKINTEQQLVQLFTYPDLSIKIKFNPHMFILRFFLSIRFNYSTKRKLQLYDFQDELHQRLPYDSLLKVLDFYQNNTLAKENIWSSQILSTVKYIAAKTTRLNKFFFIDEHTSNLSTIANIDVIDTLKNLHEKYKSLIEYITFASSPFIQEISVISYELELIGVISKFNVLCIEQKYIEAKNLLNIFINSPNTTHHQLCLLTQTIVSQLTNNQRLISDIRKILDDIYNTSLNLQSCNKYIDFNSNVFCYHETFMFYSIYKWYQAFIKLIKKYQNSNLDENISPKQFEFYHDKFLDPKITFCNSCYSHYKKYEKDINKNRQNNIFVLYEERGFISVFRQIFSDSCDIPSQELYKDSQKGHFNEFQNSKNILKSSLKDMFQALKKEIFKAQSIKQQYIILSNAEMNNIPDIDTSDSE